MTCCTTCMQQALSLELSLYLLTVAPLLPPPIAGSAVSCIYRVFITSQKNLPIVPRVLLGLAQAVVSPQSQLLIRGEREKKKKKHQASGELWSDDPACMQVKGSPLIDPEESTRDKCCGEGTEGDPGR